MEKNKASIVGSIALISVGILAPKVVEAINQTSSEKLSRCS